MERRRRRSLNLGNLLVLALTLALGTSLWVPYGTATRVARVEDHAPRVGRLLLAAGRAAMPIDFTDDAVGTAIAEDLRQRCRDAQHPESTLPELIGPPSDTDGSPMPAFCFRGKHFLFLLTEPPSELLDGAGPRRLEVYAWPRSAGAAHSAFAFLERLADDGSLRTHELFSRNLDRGYTGHEHAPRPGSARPRDGETEAIYRGADDQRWITLPEVDR